MEKSPKETYLGDGVYASNDGYQTRLRAGAESGLPDNVIFLDASVYQALLDYVDGAAREKDGGLNMPVRYGYARVSSESQSLDIQIADLNKHVCEHIRSEKVSARNLDDRPELKLLLQFMREGDELVVTRIDRLARSIVDLRNIVDLLNKRGCTLKATQQPIDTSTSIGRMMINFLGIFAEFELEIRKERQRAGIDAWKDKLARGEAEPQKRTPKYDPDEIRRLYHHNMKPRAIAKKLGCSNQTIYRVLELGATNPVSHNHEDGPSL